MKTVLFYLKKAHATLKSFMILFLLPSICLAGYNTSEDTLTKVLNNAIDYAQSGPARALCVLAIAGAGYLWIGKGALPKTYAVAIMGGSGFIFGAGYIGSKVLGLSA